MTTYAAKEKLSMSLDLSSMPPQGQITTVNDLQMYYEMYGEGSPLILLHGFTQNATFWHPYIDALAEQFRIIVPEMRGHGHSTNPTKQFTHRQAALDLFALLDQLGIQQFKTIGFSAGAHTLLHAATQQPARVEAMVLMGTAPYWPEQTRAVLRQMAPDSEHWDWDLLRQTHYQGDNQIQEIINIFYGWKDVHDDMNFTSPYLSTISASTLIIHGDRDDFFPVSLAVEMYSAIPKAYLWIVPNGGHFPFGVRTDLFTDRVLAFLQGQWQ
jgi:pimeloyl-ACP methyl ester carboxylesterase